MPVVSAERARTIAREWVGNSGGRIPGFRGAFLHGSINWLDAADPIPSTSDVDVIVVHSGPDLPPRPGKFHHKGVLLDVSFLDAGELGSPASVLENSHLAGSLRGAGVVADPSGRLTELQAAVAREYADRKWVIRRCEHAREKVIQFLHGVCETDPLHDQFTSWLFGTSVTTHVLLVAGLRNPTVRKRYLAVRGLLEEYGRLDVHEELLELLGAAHLSRPNVEQHLASMTGAFDAAKTVITTPVFFATDVSDVARPIAIDGSREMIESGFHREAVFWIAATYSRCQKVLAADAPPERRDQFTPGFRAMLADLGITSFADMARRRNKVRAYLPRLMAVAEQIIAGNPEIDDNTGM